MTTYSPAVKKQRAECRKIVCRYNDSQQRKMYSVAVREHTRLTKLLEKQQRIITNLELIRQGVY